MQGDGSPVKRPEAEAGELDGVFGTEPEQVVGREASVYDALAVEGSQRFAEHVEGRSLLSGVRWPAQQTLSTTDDAMIPCPRV